MSVWNKVLLVLIFLCAAGFVYLGGTALKYRRDSQKKLHDTQVALQNEWKKNHEYLHGTGQGDGYFSLVNEVNRIRDIRGTRVWPDCLPQSAPVVNETKVTLQLLVDAKPETPVDPDAEIPADIADTTTAGSDTESQVISIPPKDRILPGSLVYLFDNRPLEQGGSFLGEFLVDKIDNNVATLINSYLMTPTEIERINNSAAQLAPWAVYTVLPKKVTKAELLADDAGSTDSEFGDDAEITMASETQPETEKDLTPALAQTYASLNLKRMRLMLHVEMLQTQIASLKKADDMSKEVMIAFYQDENADAKTQIDKNEEQLAEVQKLHDATIAEINQMEENIASLKALNKKMLADLTDAQITVSEAINQRDASVSMAK